MKRQKLSVTSVSTAGSIKGRAPCQPASQGIDGILRPTMLFVGQAKGKGVNGRYRPEGGEKVRISQPFFITSIEAHFSSL